MPIIILYLKIAVGHEINNKMVCDICGEESACIRKITDVYGKGKHLLVIENIPMVSCSKCGERYFTAETLHEIERIKIHRTSLAIKRLTEVVSF